METETLKIWQMTLLEYRQFLKGKKIEHSYYNREGQIQFNHRNEVEWALQLDKNIPENVLLDYPLLVEKWTNIRKNCVMGKGDING